MPKLIFEMGKGFIHDSQNDNSSSGASTKDDSNKKDLLKLQEDNDD